MARLEAGQSQLVRFMLTKKGPLATQRLKRVSFEGIPFARGADNQVQTTFRQNIPMIIQPRSLEKLKDPWTRLTATVDGDRLRLCNDSAYVVRLAQQARLDSGNIAVPLPKTYLLPGERLELPVRASSRAPPARSRSGRPRSTAMPWAPTQSPCRAPASPHQGNEAARGGGPGCDSLHDGLLCRVRAAVRSPNLEAAGHLARSRGLLQQDRALSARRQPVRLVVNGTDLGTMDVRFSDEGTLCFTPELLQRAGLKVPDGTSEESCQDYRKAYPETAITQLPNQSQVDIVTPLAARAPSNSRSRGSTPRAAPPP